jgi:heme exporter protein CcmD
MSFLALPHIGFVIAAYAIAFTAVVLLIGWVALDHRALRRALAPYEGAPRRFPELHEPGP